MIVVDYRCGNCGHRAERWVSTPPPSHVACHCGGPARRLFSGANLLGLAPDPDSVTKSARNEPPACRTNPMIPGLCHITPGAAKAFVARATGDNRTLDREIERQERALRDDPGGIVDPIFGHAGAST